MGRRRGRRGTSASAEEGSRWRLACVRCGSVVDFGVGAIPAAGSGLNLVKRTQFARRRREGGGRDGAFVQTNPIGVSETPAIGDFGRCGWRCRTNPICQAASGGRRPRRGFCTNEANRGERDACDWGFRTLRVAVSNEPNLRGGVGAEWPEGLLCKRSQFWRAWRGSGARAGPSARRGRCAGARGFPPGPGWVPCGRWWAGGCR